MPRFLLKIGFQSFVVCNKNGIGALTELLADAVPVTDNTYKDRPEIELTWVDEPGLAKAAIRVVCERIPANVIWTQKTRTGEVVQVRPVEKAPKALKAPPRKALPPPKRIALPPPNPQMALL